MKRHYTKRTPIEKLYKHRSIDAKTECWNWNGNIGKNGYGKIMVFIGGVQKTLSVHRYSYSIHYNDELTKFDVICHQCHNRKCFNPKHLKKSTQSVNIIEKVEDWNEFRKENEILVNEYLLIKEKLNNTYLAWHKNFS